MKLSLVISTSDAEFDALAFKGDLVSGIKMAKEIGYEAIEIAIRDPKSVDVEEIKKTVNELNMNVSAIGTGQIFLMEGLSIASEDRGIIEKAKTRLKSHIDFAKELNAIVIIGLARGKVGNRNKDKVISIFKDSLSELAEYAQKNEVKLVVEAINRYEVDYINTLKEAYEIVKEINYDNLGVLADTFHMNIEERDFVESIKEVKDKLFHFHVADSNRWAPGYGHIDFKSIFKALKDINYDGYVSVESLPLPKDSKTSAYESYKFLTHLMSEIFSEKF